MARDISELGADVFDDSPKQEHRISPKKRNYIIGLSVLGALLAGAIAGSAVAINTVLLDYSNMDNITYYYTPKNLLAEGEEPTAVLYKLKSDKKYKSTFRIPNRVQGYKVVGVADKAFIGHSEIKKVIMPNSLKFVGEEAFKDCTSLSSFTWSKKLDDVGLDAFANTAFYKKLSTKTNERYVLPSGTLIYVGKDYFKMNTALVSDEISDAEINTIKTTYSTSEVKKFGALGANNIAAGVFKENDKLCFVDLPDQLNAVSKYMFEGCYNLKGVEGTHSKLTEIQYRAFANCTQLKDIILPAGLTTLGDQAFANTGLVDNIPDVSTVTNLGERIFENCTELTTVIYKGNRIPHYTFSGCESLENFYWGDTSNSNIDNVNYFGIGAFAGTKFSTFNIPKNVSTLYDDAFSGCANLTKVSMWANPSSLVAPGVYLNTSYIVARMVDNVEHDPFEIAAFSGSGSKISWSCSDEELVEFSKTESVDDEVITVKPLGEGIVDIFAKVTIDGVEYEDSFEMLMSKDDKTMDSVDEKEYPTYLSGTGVETRGKLRGVTDIKSGSFSGCVNLTTIDLFDDNYVHYEGAANEFTFPASLSITGGSDATGEADSYTFMKTATTAVHIGNNVKSIANYAFQDCVKLETVSMNNPSINLLNMVGNSAFENCSSLVSFDIPSGVSYLGTVAFGNCENLENVGLGDTQVTTILGKTFYNCQKLASIDLPESISSIKKESFYQNYALEHIIVPHAVTDIGESAFTRMRPSNEEGGFDTTMPLYFDSTLTEIKSKSGMFPGNIFDGDKQKWHDGSIKMYFLLGPGEEKQEGYFYWDGNKADPQPI